MEEELKLTELEQDALKETANIGAGNASATLSGQLKKKVTIVVSDLNFINLDNLADVIGGPKKLIVGIYTPIQGDFGGTVMIMFAIESAIQLSNILKGTPDRTEQTLSGEDQAALRNMGNVVSDSYLNALAEFLDMSMQRSESKIVSTFGENVVDLIMLSIDQESNHGLLIKTDFNVEGSDIAGKFILLITTNKIDNIRQKIKEKFGE